MLWFGEHNDELEIKPQTVSYVSRGCICSLLIIKD
jgi:hypothetical protein